MGLSSIFYLDQKLKEMHDRLLSLERLITPIDLEVVCGELQAFTPQIDCKLNGGILPFKARDTDAGYDLYSIEDVELPFGKPTKIKTGVHFGLPNGFFGLIRDRSGLGAKGIVVHAGVIDQEYVGEVVVILNNLADGTTYSISKGDRIAQIILLPSYLSTLNLVDDIKETDRGNKGFGSSGK